MDGFAAIPDMDAESRAHDQYGVKGNPVAAAKVMDDMLLESGAELFYGQMLVDVQTEGDRITAAAEAIRTGVDVCRVPAEAVRRRLRENGAIVPGLTPPVSFREAMERNTEKGACP